MLEGTDALIHLAGASVAEGRWTPPRKKILRASRVEATQKLVAALRRLGMPPRVMIAASAVGYYGNRGDEKLSEASPPGNDFAAQLCIDWEAASMEAESLGIRVVTLRFGVVLSSAGGALTKMLPPFRFGVGGRLGSGRQWISWLTRPDALGIIRHAMEDSNLRGPVNAVSPSPVTNSEFTRILAKALHRPAIFPVPALALRALVGEMADGLLLASQRVVPEKLHASLYSFRHPDLASALSSTLDKPD